MAISTYVELYLLFFLVALFWILRICASSPFNREGIAGMDNDEWMMAIFLGLVWPVSIFILIIYLSGKFLNSSHKRKFGK